MRLKRYLVLAASVLLFIIAYVGYFEYTNAQMEDHFHKERVEAGVENSVLIAANSPDTAPPAPISSPVPASTNGTPDSANLIGPVPPAAASTPDAASAPAPAPDTTVAPAAPVIDNTPPTPAPAAAAPDNSPPPATPDTNSAPMAPSSTMNYPRENASPFLVLAAYHPSRFLTQTTTAEAPIAPVPPAAPVPTPATTNVTPGAPSVSAPATNTAGSTPVPPATGPSRPVPVEASVIILGYHQFVGPGQSSKNPYVMRQDVFEGEMKYLKDNGYHVVPLADVVRYIKHEIGLPPNSVAITIDDGYKSAIVYAAPVLKKYGYPWTYFVYPDFITVAEGKGAASWNDLLALQADGVDIESHSMTHPFLTSHHQKIKGVWHNFTQDEYDQWLTNETAGSKALLEQKMGKPIPYLAYPYGAYNKEVEAKAVAAGYDAIFTVADNPVHTNTNIHSVGRYVITQPVEKNFAAYLRQGALGVADADPAPGSTTSNPRPVITAVLGYEGTLDPNAIETTVRDFGIVRHDFDPKTSIVRLYLPRDLVQPVNIVNIRVKDAQTGQIMVANWHFNYEPGTAAVVHPPIGAPTNAPAAITNVPAAVAPKVAPAPAPVPAITNPAPVRPAVPTPAASAASSKGTKNPGQPD